MGADSKIEWCDHTFNAWAGCTKVSAACDRCYAEAWAKRTGFVTWGHGEPRRRTSAAYWRQPLKWDAEARRVGKRARVFCNSLSDVFDTEVPDAWRDDLFALIAATPTLDWLMLTKRTKVMADWFERRGVPPNVWPGTTVEDQAMADLRIPELLRIEAAPVRFLSMEPLLSWVDLGPFLRIRDRGIDWVIVGGESGPGARPFPIQAARSILDQCHLAGIARFVKQLGARPRQLGPQMVDDDNEFLRLRDRKGGDPAEWPLSLRVREMPSIEGDQR